MLGIVLQYEYYLEYTFLPLSQIYTFLKLHYTILSIKRPAILVLSFNLAPLLIIPPQPEFHPSYPLFKSFFLAV